MADWDRLRIALAVIESAISAAARALGMNAATVSRNLAALEDDLGQPIVERQPGNIVVTPFGSEIVEPLRRARGALAGLGCAVMTWQTAARYRDLEPVPGLPCGPEVPLWLATPATLRRVPRVAAVWDWIIGFIASDAPPRGP